MVINLGFERPFHGLVFGENRFEREECRWRGNGGHYLLVVVPLDYSGDNATSVPVKNEVTEGQRVGFCGLRFDQVRRGSLGFRALKRRNLWERVLIKMARCS